MYLLFADDIQLTVATHILLSHASFTVQAGDKIGLVGKNGTGKTTLVQALANKSRPKKGEIDIKCTTFYVPQETRLAEEHKRLAVISYAMIFSDEGWNVFHLIEELFDYQQITAEKLMEQLSGGELTMLHLALGLLVEPDVLLLDEPTNHLDQLGSERLIARLKQYRKALLIISHDSFVLNEVVDRIWEIRDKTLFKYKGNYDYFIDVKSHEVEVLQRKLRDEKKEMKYALERKQRAAEQIMRREADIKKMKGSGVPKIQQGFFLDQSAKSTSRAMALAKSAQRDIASATKDIKAKLKHSQTLNIELGTADDSIFSLVDIHNGKLTIEHGTITLLENITLRITNQDKVLIAGRNGTGKSSLLKAIHKMDDYILSAESKPILPVDSLYIDQHYSLIDPQKTLVTHIAELVPLMEYEEIRKVLGNYLFMAEDQVNQIAKTLSGGEKARLAFAMASVSPRTLLLLDEPTNNLDVESVAELVFALNNYQGGVAIVSHDIGFVDQLSITRKVVIGNKRVENIL